jgi:hypothetical protein
VLGLDGWTILCYGFTAAELCFFLKEQEEQAPTGYVLRGDKINTNLNPKKGNKKVTMKT